MHESVVGPSQPSARCPVMSEVEGRPDLTAHGRNRRCRMREATAEQRDDHVLMPTGIHGPDLDEDLSVEGMIEGRPAAPRPRQDVSSRRPVADPWRFYAKD